MWPVPPAILEIFNAWLAVVLPLPMWSALRYLARRRPMFDSFRDFYRGNRMAISVMIIFAGMEVRTVNDLARETVRSIGIDRFSHRVVPLMEGSITWIFIGSTFVAVFGAICWGRVAVDSPLSRPGAWIFAVLALGACAAVALWPAL